jgi:hypothetical protein
MTNDAQVPADRPDLTDEDHEMIDPDAIVIAEDSADPDDPDDLDDLDEAADGTHPDTVVAEAIVVEPGTAVNGDAPRGGPMAGDPDRLHERWAAIQSTFVDDPRGSVTSAADMVTEVIATVAASAKERESGLRGEWDRDGVDTERLRNALRSYRSLLDQLAAL